jgi:N-acetylmuramoyl-L-alanine amidase
VNSSRGSISIVFSDGSWKENLMKHQSISLCSLSLVILLLGIHFTSQISSAAGSLTGNTICIDPGHGGSDPGAENADFNLLESEINLDVSFGLKTLLENDGATVVMTRTDDTSKDNSDRYTLCNSEQATILVSVHTNSVVDPSWDGSMALYFHPDEDDKILAQSIYDVMYPYLKETAPDSDNFISYSLDWFASGVLMRSEMPATMVEPLFMSNPAEAELLLIRIYDSPVSGSINDACDDFSCRRGQIAQALYMGILSYFEGTEPTPTPDPVGSIHVAAIEMWYQQKGPNYFISTQVTILDKNGDPVSAVEVSISTTKPEGSTIYNSGITKDDGTIIFKLVSNQSGIYESTVTNLIKEGWVYEEADNIETTEQITVP